MFFGLARLWAQLIVHRVLSREVGRHRVLVDRVLGVLLSGDLERSAAARRPLPRRRTGGALGRLGKQVLEVRDLFLQDFVLRLQLGVLNLQSLSEDF